MLKERHYTSQINTSISVVHLNRNSYVEFQHIDIHKREKVLIFYIISYLKHSDRIKGPLDMFNPIKLLENMIMTEDVILSSL